MNRRLENEEPSIYLICERYKTKESCQKLNIIQQKG